MTDEPEVTGGAVWQVGQVHGQGQGFLVLLSLREPGGEWRHYPFAPDYALELVGSRSPRRAWRR